MNLNEIFLKFMNNIEGGQTVENSFAINSF